MVKLPDLEARPPSTARIEAFSDGVIAILITIMVLDLKLPTDLFHGSRLADVLIVFWPKLVVYAVSFVMIASCQMRQGQGQHPLAL